MITLGLSTGFFIVTSSIPVWLRWIKYLAYPNLCYSILASNELTDRLFTCPYIGPDGGRDPLMCGPYDGNNVLLNQLDLKTNYYPDPIVQLVYYFLAFLFIAWFALTVHIVNPTSMGSGPTLMDIFINQAVKMFSRKKKVVVRQSDSSASSDTSVDLEKAKMGETRLDVFSKGLDRRDPVTIRVEALSLSVFLSTSEWSFRGFLSALKKETREKKLLREVDVVFPAGELTAILGGSGAGKVKLPRIRGCLDFLDVVVKLSFLTDMYNYLVI